MAQSEVPIHLLPIRDQWQARRVQIKPPEAVGQDGLPGQIDQANQASTLIPIQPAEGPILDSALQATVNSAQLANTQLGVKSADPHCDQFVTRFGKPPAHMSLRRTLLNAEPVFHYQERYDETKTVIGWGQRKLAVAVIEFLTLYSRAGDTVVYAGASPGTNIAFIADLFPQLTFHLYDPRKFDLLLQNYRNVETFQDYFTDDTAASYRYDDQGYPRQDVLLISDIRTGGNDDNTVEFEEHVWQDMLMQQRWYFIMQPRQAQLKFRLPYKIDEVAVPEQLEYLDGVIFLQAWAKVTSGETRLVPNGRMKLWQTKLYEDQMFQHNIAGRVSLYDNPVAVGSGGPVVPGMDHCFDCASEAAIFRQYLLRKGESWTNQEIVRLSLILSNIISRGRTNLANYVAVYNNSK